jgi:antitoxin component of RelBE/YafQ-DinJ toxin-antitoxin module
MTSQIVSVRIDNKIKKMVQNLAKKQWLTLSNIINLKLREFIITKKLNINFDDTDIEYYKNNSDYVDFWWVDANEVLWYLKKSFKNERVAKIYK